MTDEDGGARQLAGCEGAFWGFFFGALIPSACLMLLPPGGQAQGMIFVVPCALLGLAIGLAKGLLQADAEAMETAGQREQTDDGAIQDRQTGAKET